MVIQILAVRRWCIVGFSIETLPFYDVTSPVHTVIELFPLFALPKIWAIICKRETLLNSRPVEVSTYLHSVYKPMLVAVSSHLRSQTITCLTAGQTTCSVLQLSPSQVGNREGASFERVLCTAMCSLSGWQWGGGFFRTSIRTHRFSLHNFLITTLLYHSTDLSLLIPTAKLHFVH